MLNCVEGKTILVTGGTGSIGGELVKQLLALNPRTVRIFEHHEDSLFTCNYSGRHHLDATNKMILYPLPHKSI